METQAIYQQAIRFAAQKHAESNQTIPGTKIPYAVHISNVAMEILFAYQSAPDFDLNFALQVALLHDTLEDTATTFNELATTFGDEVAAAVAALTKNDALPKEKKMQDSLTRIQVLRKEVAAVKLADRITNLQSPPAHWTHTKIIAYQHEAALIAAQLAVANAYLGNRLQEKILAYSSYANA